MRKKIIENLNWFNFISCCLLCTQRSQKDFSICKDCTDLIQPIGPACRYCALPLPVGDFLICGQCIKEKPAFDEVITAYHFSEPLRTIIHDFKYKEAFYWRSFLIKLMWDALPKIRLKPQCLIPVPLHPKRLQARGFNQAAELAKVLAKKLKLPSQLTHCRRLINTKPQVNLTAKERRKNLCSVFKTKPISYSHVIIIDDLLTTGSTANELAKTLKKNGVERVDVWCCARAS